MQKRAVDNRYNCRLMSNLFIARRGTGPLSIVLLHGWGMHGGVFEPLAAALEPHCSLYLVDLPGHGHSRDCEVPLETAACAAAIAAATPPALWLGWSLGGLIALQAALDRPDAVQALAMLCASPCFLRKADWPHAVADQVLAELASDLRRDHRETLDRFLTLEAMGSDDARAVVRSLRAELYAHGAPSPRVLEQGLDTLRDTDLRGRLGELVQPSCWLAGARDRLIPWQAMQASAEAANGKFSRIEHAGHAPFLGAASLVAEEILALAPRAVT